MGEEHVRVRLERSGGQLGVWPTLVLDSADLSPVEVDSLRELITQASWYQAPASVVPDSVEYHVRASIGPRLWEARVRDPQVPASLRALLKHVQRHGQKISDGDVENP